MNREQLTGKIGELVDVLRTDADRRITMSDIASITEVLITTMERYFGSIDTSIYREFQELSDHISTLRSEIARAQIQADRIPRAGKELDEVVKATEEATNTIMEAAEEMMSADTSDPAAYQTSVNDACMKIFEACSFQDITGQRVTKVITTLTFIEERLGAILTAWNPSDEELGTGATEEVGGDAALLNGPALAGEGVNQDEVDAMLAGDGAAPTAAATAQAEAAAPPKAPLAEAVEGDAALLNGPALPGEGVNQDDVDAMLADATPVAPPAPPKPAPPPVAKEAEPQPLAAAPPPRAPVAEPPAPAADANEEEPNERDLYG